MLARGGVAAAAARGRGAVGAAAGSRLASTWAEVPMGPADPILGLTEMYNKDTDPRKVSLGVGAYRGEDGKPWVLPSVRAAEKKILEDGVNKEYLGISGLPSFVDLSLRFGYGDNSAPLKEGRIAGVQTLSGTGACRLVGEFFNRFGISAQNAIYMPNPTWGNHIPIFRDAGMEVKQYTYFDRDIVGVNVEGMIKDMKDAPDGSAFLLHACAHNPTGSDPTMDQWREISDVMKTKKHVPFFDCAYQGFASGDAEKDAGAIRLFVDEGHQVLLGQSFAKNFGLYGERVGALSVVCADKDEAARVESQLKLLIRPMYSNPPANGARIVQTILSDPALEKQWREECKSMADRIIRMRDLLKSNLEKEGSSRDWSHVTDQIGMFCYSGITEDQVLEMREKHHVYMTKDGRISMAGVTKENVSYLAAALHEVTK
ncbi:Aspartate aminotransferase, mitochondrial [Hondaea fermentalgiana]|uniref:Aspartate aminotransferase n=1 Tax=Hondaea fermentalgiana TaxID=2315210 RepID=A0A2R5G2Y0_9STRA|nr:Aspartate aminotransferase, mitochondrial [Hondaea fermentalgiana]|eukprot:GBG24679.1 Aspartate aminotransferase, mitochondrial [Hondaea fermentalgiana]